MKRFFDVIAYFLGLFGNICLMALFLFLVYHYANKGYAYGKELVDAETSTHSPKAVSVNIPEGADALAIGGILEDAGLAGNKYIFWLQSRLNGTYRLFKAGDYDLDMAMSPNQIMDELKKERFTVSDFVTITIAEGLNIRQIGQIAESKDIFTEEAFIAACDAFNAAAYDFLPPESEGRNPLEGYLFPDTYYLPANPVPDDLIIRMLNRFEDVLNELVGELSDSARPLDEVVIIASMVEKEIKRDEERALAVSVIENRIQDDMRLEIDATVVYILDKRADRLMDADLQVESPYNTYRINGLPVGPICNPGRDSIIAAAHPAETDFLYYVVSNRETGEHFFTADYDAFLEAKAQYIASGEE